LGAVLVEKENKENVDDGDGIKFTRLKEVGSLA
jgi:hypothetical protein